jgi:DNA-binding transcriptional MerR regulator/methylmalonyl-CoA mutase cobalamin-binding subunit
MDHTTEKSGHNISAVERAAGLSKDTLRVWERRYGFPRPVRDENGERTYSEADVAKLRLLRRLIDRGYRPGKIVDLPVSELNKLSEALGEAETPPALRALIDLLKARRTIELQGALTQVLVRDGLEGFILNTIAPLNYHVGVAWMRGAIEIYEEHIYTEVTQSLLRSAIGNLPSTDRPPRVLLTTFPNEQHGLGLLMVQALLGGNGATCISLGTQTPLEDIIAAAQSHAADIVALSFSAAYSATHLVEGLTELRTRLPSRMALWAGGSNPALSRRPIEGITTLTRLEEVRAALETWRTLRRAESRY